MKSILFSFAILALASFSSCEKEDTSSNVQTEFPVIDSLVANTIRVQAGGEEPAILNCYATGGDLDYVWEVDLGDLFTTNGSGSEVQYTASACCLGEREITCTVSNNKGDVSESIVITIN
jgi:hypothetical protein